jgi:DNA polymerase-4
MARLIMHVDMDAFFAAIEQRDHAEYRGRPLIVGARPGSRGVVATCSYEARVFGVRSAMPVSEAYRRCPQGIYVPPDLGKYAAVSHQVMEILDRVSPLVEPVSIDEAYLDISGLERLFGPPEEIGRRVKQAVGKELGLTVSVGVGPNRLIAKLASDFRKPDGLTLVPPEGVQAFLDPMPVAALRGVGQRTLERLQRLGVRRVEQLRRYSVDDLQRHFGDKGGQHLYRQARGRASNQVGERTPRRSISKETTFEHDLDDPQALHDTLLRLAAEVGWIARRKGFEGQVVTLKLRLAGFETHTRQRKLGAPTAADQRIFQNAWSLYQDSGFTGRPVRLIGVGISGWDEGEPFQGDLFSPAEDREREQRLYATLDRVGQRFGRGKLRLGLPKGGKRG